MGRRKIEIKAIKDDRNRSVTFLKRKGGLFKKAHELSVLCSVDVAVIIFGANKKLYQFSSCDINDVIGRHQYYGAAHEHKGPSDFNGKRDGDGSDEEEVDEAAIEESMRQHQEHAHMPPHMAGYNPMRAAPSASPPVGNGVMGYHPRQHTPQPVGSRPDSRNAGMIRRPGSNLGHHPPGQVPNGYTAYLQQQQQQQQHQQHQQQHQHQHPHPHSHQQPPSQPPHQHPQQPQQGPYPPPPPQPPPSQQSYSYSQAPTQPAPHAQMHGQYLEERRVSVSAPYRPPSEPHRQSTPQPSQQPTAPQVQPPPPQQQQTSQQPPQSSTPPQTEQRQDLLQVQQPQPKPLGFKSKSIFTPVDDNRSMLASQWGPPTTERDLTPIKQERHALSEHMRPGPPEMPPISATYPPVAPPQRTQSTASLSGEKRPNLKLQIPTEEQGDGEGTTASPSAIQDSPKANNDSASKEQPTSKPSEPSLSAAGGSGVVLPPPSPSASALLSAGAQGPPNPFARPLPPGAAGQNQQAFGSNQNIETPMSALPSRFVADQFLPSPSSFYPEWGFGSAGGGRSAGGDGGNMLPSPLNWQTPVGGNAPGFGEKSGEGESGVKREREGGDEGEAKRVKA